MRRWIVVLLPLLPLVLLLAYVRLSAAGPQVPPQIPPPPPAQVSYVVRGTARSAAVTYSNATSGIERRTVSLPWDYRMERGRGTAAYVAAQSQDDAGSVICEIVVDGARAAENSGASAAQIVACDGLVR